MKNQYSESSYYFLKGGGVCGKLLRETDWLSNSLGEPIQWPTTLKTAVRMMLDSPVAFCVFWGDSYIQFYNDAFIPSFGSTRHPEAMGKPIQSTSQRWSVVEPMLARVMSGETEYQKNLKIENNRHGFVEDCYFNVCYMPLYLDDGSVGGVYSIVEEITENVRVLDRLTTSEARFRSLIERASVATCLFTGREMKVEIANDSMLAFWGKGKAALGKSIGVAVPELNDQPFLKLLDDVFTTGITYTGKEMPAVLEENGQFRTSYFDFTYTAMTDAKGEIYGVMNMAIDVTEKVMSRKKLEKTQKQLMTYFEESPVAVAIIDKEDLTFRMANRFYAELVGRKPEELVNKPMLVALPELGGQGFDLLLNEVIKTGVAFSAQEISAQIFRNNKMDTIYVDLTYQPRREGPNEEIVGVLVVATDITQQVVANRELAYSKNQLQFAIEATELGTWEMDPKTNVFTGNARLKSWIGLGPDDEIDIETTRKTIQKEDQELVNAALAKAFDPASGGKYEVQYGITNPKTGKKMIVKAKGMVLFNEEGEALRFNGTLQDVTKETIAKDIERAEIEKIVAERTLELEEANLSLYKSNLELSQYAYVASHDLQEPLRKIMIFSGMLSNQNSLTDENKPIIAKIRQSSERMSLLIKDLLEYSKLLNSEKMIRPVDLNQAIQDVISDFDLSIAEKNAVITIGEMPVIEAVSLQMNQLFYNLIGNALKFMDTGKIPSIEIRSRLLPVEELTRYIPQPPNNIDYYDITVTDNGIGFEEKYSEQIMEVFKRLHPKNIYPGSGIGLSLCRKIVQNHHGFMYASSKVGTGSTFHLILPLSNPT